MDLDKYVAVASLDLSAAFNLVNVEILLIRLSAMGIPEDLVLILTDWLKDRSAFVEVNGHCSAYFLVEDGKVQGSALGPILLTSSSDG